MMNPRKLFKKISEKLKKDLSNSMLQGQMFLTFLFLVSTKKRKNPLFVP